MLLYRSWAVSMICAENKMTAAYSVGEHTAALFRLKAGLSPFQTDQALRISVTS